jgi:hypothetical protein
MLWHQRTAQAVDIELNNIRSLHVEYRSAPAQHSLQPYPFVDDTMIPSIVSCDWLYKETVKYIQWLTLEEPLQSFPAANQPLNQQQQLSQLHQYWKKTIYKTKFFGELIRAVLHFLIEQGDIYKLFGRPAAIPTTDNRKKSQMKSHSSPSNLIMPKAMPTITAEKGVQATTLRGHKPSFVLEWKPMDLFCMKVKNDRRMYHTWEEFLEDITRMVKHVILIDRHKKKAIRFTSFLCQAAFSFYVTTLKSIDHAKEVWENDDKYPYPILCESIEKES